MPPVQQLRQAWLSPTHPSRAFRLIVAVQEYQEAFVFEKQDRAKGAGKKRVTYFSDLTLAEPEKQDAER